MSKPNLEALLDWIAAGNPLAFGTKMYNAMHYYSNEALRLQAALNTGFHSPEDIRKLMEELTGGKISDTFRLFPPFYTDFGKNIHFGENVFINSCCCFQDQGGIYIGNGCLIGHRATIATINHGASVAERGILYCKPVCLEANVWLGSNVTILPGATIGTGSIVAAGSVVTNHIPAMTIVAGNPARKIKDVPN